MDGWIDRSVESSRQMAHLAGFSCFGVLFVWLFGCLVVWLFGCLVVWLVGRLVVWLFGCLVVWWFDVLFAILFASCMLWSHS